MRCILSEFAIGVDIIRILMDIDVVMTTLADMKEIQINQCVLSMMNLCELLRKLVPKKHDDCLDCKFYAYPYCMYNVVIYNVQEIEFEPIWHAGCPTHEYKFV